MALHVQTGIHMQCSSMSAYLHEALGSPRLEPAHGMGGCVARPVVRHLQGPHGVSLVGPGRIWRRTHGGDIQRPFALLAPPMCRMVRSPWDQAINGR